MKRIIAGTIFILLGLACFLALIFIWSQQVTWEATVFTGVPVVLLGTGFASLGVAVLYGMSLREALEHSIYF